MITFPKQIASEFFEYSSPLSPETLVDEIKNLLDSTTDSNTNINLKGELINGNEFEITRQWGELTINAVKGLPIKNPNSITTIKALVFKNNLNQTQINVVIIPNSVLQVSFLVLPILFLIVVYEMITGNIELLLFLGLILGIILISTLILWVSAYSKQKLLKRFVTQFDFQKL